MNGTQRIDVCSGEGTLLFRLYLTTGPLPAGGKTKGNGSKKQDRNDGGAKTKPNGKQAGEKDNGKESGTANEPKSKSDGDTMTSAQRRYLFRLLAEKGIEGDRIEEELKKRFQVSALTEVSKFEASRAIENLLETQNGGNDDDLPF